jgi:hypothetical protein
LALSAWKTNRSHRQLSTGEVAASAVVGAALLAERSHAPAQPSRKKNSPDPVILIGAVMWLAWHAPGRAGVVLLLFSPIGFFLLALGSTSSDPQAQVILGLVWWVEIPFISGVLLVIADRVLPVARNEETDRS